MLFLAVVFLIDWVFFIYFVREVVGGFGGFFGVGVTFFCELFFLFHFENLSRRMALFLGHIIIFFFLNAIATLVLKYGSPIHRPRKAKKVKTRLLCVSASQSHLEALFCQMHVSE